MQINLSNNALCGLRYVGRGKYEGAYTAEGITAIANALKVTASVTSLSTAYNRITGDGAQQLASAVLAKPTLENFSGIPLKKLRADSLTALNLSEKGLGVPEAMVLADLLRSVSASVTSVNVLSNQLDVDSADLLLKVKAEKPNLRTLCGLTHEETELDFRHKGLGPGDAKLLAPEISVIAPVTSLSTAYNNISGDGARQLASAVLAKPTLETFSGIPLKEVRADSLTTLDLSNKGLGVAEAMVLADLLPVMASVTKVR